MGPRVQPLGPKHVCVCGGVRWYQHEYFDEARRHHCITKVIVRTCHTKSLLMRAQMHAPRKGVWTSAELYGNCTIVYRKWNANH